MQYTDNQYKQATKIREIDASVRFDIPVNPQHPFYVDFSHVRGEFQEKVIYKALNVNPRDFTYTTSPFNKSLLFLGGMRGSGKTSELSKYTLNLDNPDCFFVVTCNIDNELDLNDMEYMDILIFQVEKLLQKAKDNDLNIDDEILVKLKNWFSERVHEINSYVRKEGGVDFGAEAKTPSLLLGILNITGRLKAGISVGKDNATKIRNVFKQRFNDFAQIFNNFIEEVNFILRRDRIAKEVLFIIDGLEKTMSADTRKMIIIDESNRLRQIKVNTIITLPIELMSKRNILEQFSTVASFPFVKIMEKDGQLRNQAIDKFKEFIFKRINENLFESIEVVEKAILFSGGSPRELLRILEYTNYFIEEDNTRIDLKSLDKALKKLSSQSVNYLTEEDFKKLKQIKENNSQNKPVPFDETLQKLLEELIVFEYNDGSYKRVNPIVELSDAYKIYV
ncbi:MAG: hypothetical protein U5N85_13055 [Arcicella sp.]|nr:hypothetical protein [Arcicella sp.]